MTFVVPLKISSAILAKVYPTDQSTLAAVKVSGGVAKKAIIKRLADKLRTGRKTFAESGARSVVGLSIYKDEVTVTLDTSGEGLHKRGYRSLAYSAPLKETLASALIDSTFYNPDKDIDAFQNRKGGSAKNASSAFGQRCEA